MAADAQGQVVVAAIERLWTTRNAKVRPRESRLLVWRSEDQGRSWSPPFALHQSPEFGMTQADPWLQSTGRGEFAIVFMAASRDRPDLPGAVFQRSADGGKTWTKPHAFHRWVDKTVLAVSPSGKELAVAFTTFDPDKGRGVGVHRSPDKGKTWQELPATFAAPTKTYTAQGMVLSDQGAIAIAWKEARGGPGSETFRHAITTTIDGGHDWKTKEFAAVPYHLADELQLTGPALSLDDAGRLLAVSIPPNDSDGRFSVLLRWSKDFQTWSDPMRLADGQGVEYRGYPAVAASGRRIHVAWMERKDKKYHVWYRGSADSGQTWSDRLLLSRPDHASDALTPDGFPEPGGHYMSLADDGTGLVHAVWGVQHQARGEIWHSTIRWVD